MWSSGIFHGKDASDPADVDRGGVHPDLLDGAMPHFPNSPIKPITGRSPYIVVPMVPDTITPR